LRNSIPPEIGSLTGLTGLYLANNALSGPIPSSIGSLTNLGTLSLSRNQLSGPIPSTIGSLTKLTLLELSFNQLSGSIPSTIGSLRSLKTLFITNNQLSGPIPSTIGSLGSLWTLYLSNNQLSGSIPSTIGSLLTLRSLLLDNNKLSGALPSEMGVLRNLELLGLNNNQFSGPIPSSYGSLTNLLFLWLYENQLTGYPSSFLSLPKLRERRLFPNPMSNVPYDVVVPASIGTLTAVTWTPFLNTQVKLRKRQALSTSALVSTAELIRMCPLNNVQNADVAAGCVAGIYNRFCYNPSNPSLLAQCHDAYNRAFGASFFKPLGDVCPAWRKGPLSASCARAIQSFSYNLFMRMDPITGQPVF